MKNHTRAELDKLSEETIKKMNSYTRAKLDKLSAEAITKKAMKDLFSVSISLNQLRSLTYRIKNKDTLETIHASLTKNKIYIDQLLERIDNVL